MNLKIWSSILNQVYYLYALVNINAFLSDLKFKVENTSN